MNPNRLLTALLFALTPTWLPTAYATTWDLAADWSDTSNPNGVWTYMVNGALGVSGTRGFDNFGPPGPPLAWLWKDNSGWPSYSHTGWSQANGSEAAMVGGPIDLQPGDIYCHTGLPLAIDWTSPIAGSVQVHGGVWMPRDIGRSGDWQVTLNGTDILASGLVYSGDPYSRATPDAFDFTLQVQPGDVLAFQPHGWDYTAVNFIVTDAPEPASLGLLGLGVLGLLTRRRHRRG